MKIKMWKEFKKLMTKLACFNQYSLPDLKKDESINDLIDEEYEDKD